MLHQFLTANRDILIEHCRTLSAERDPAALPDEKSRNGIPSFIDQLAKTLCEGTADSLNREKVGPLNGESEKQQPTTLSKTASKYGEELLKNGYTVDQVVHAYGDVCQAVTELAHKRHAPIAASEFKVFNLCLDDAIAAAVTEFDRLRDRDVRVSGNIALNGRLQVLALELRSNVSTVMLAMAVIRRGTVGINGATAGIVDSTLIAMRNACDATLAEARKH